jgi:hypothetical protein
MIERMFTDAGPDFGVRLTPENLAQRNAAVRAQRQAVVCGKDHAVLLTSLGQQYGVDDCPRISTRATHRDPT